ATYAATRYWAGSSAMRRRWAPRCWAEMKSPIRSPHPVPGNLGPVSNYNTIFTPGGSFDGRRLERAVALARARPPAQLLDHLRRQIDQAVEKDVAVDGQQADLSLAYDQKGHGVYRDARTAAAAEGELAAFL